MIIDFHTHTFPDKIADKALRKLQLSSDTRSYLNGTQEDLIKSMHKYGIDYSVVLPVATSPAQSEGINEKAYQLNSMIDKHHLISFGGIHPDNENYKEILISLRERGFKGIKIHPLFQNVAIDDERFLRIIDTASELDLITVVHAGYDISYGKADLSSTSRIKHVIELVSPQKLVLAHMGGWEDWELVYELLAGMDVYFDTSFSITPIRSCKSTLENLPDDFVSFHADEQTQMDSTLFKKLILKHGYERILFGSDSPWSDQGENIQALHSLIPNEKELSAILYENAAKLLNLKA